MAKRIGITEASRNELKAYLQCFLRSYFVGCGFNTKGLQNIGFSFALDPGLVCLIDDPAKLKAARKRYAKHYNSHPFWAPFLIGLFLYLEKQISKGIFPEAVVDKVKNTTSYTLSAIGDSVFAGTGLIFWVLSTLNLLVAGHHAQAVLLGVGLFIGLQFFKIYTFCNVLSKGLIFLEDLKKWDLINWGQRIKYANAFLLVLLWIQLWPEPLNIYEWYLGVAAIGLGAWVVSVTKFPRALVALIIAVSLLLQNVIYDFLQ